MDGSHIWVGILDLRGTTATHRSFGLVLLPVAKNKEGCATFSIIGFIWPSVFQVKIIEAFYNIYLYNIKAFFLSVVVQ